MQRKRDSLKADNGFMSVLHYNIPNVTVDTEFINNINEANGKVIIPAYDAEYYQFDIATFGWYNLDFLLKDWDKLPESNLVVKLQGEHKDRVNVFLVVPAYKIFAGGGFLKNSDDFGFDGDNGVTKLPQNTDAWIIAVSEQNEKTYYAQQHFVTSPSQTINISLQEIGRDSILALFASLGLPQTQLKVLKTKNFDNMKAVDAELEKLKSKLAGCACVDSAILRDK